MSLNRGWVVRKIPGCGRLFRSKSDFLSQPIKDLLIFKDIRLASMLAFYFFVLMRRASGQC
jgi:hypothetical protein